MFGMLRNLWSYKNFICSSVGNEMRLRFARSKFGCFWMVLNPLAQVAIYTLVLSNVLQARIPGAQDQYSYAIYLMSGLLAWNLFAEVITRCLSLFVVQANLMKKINFPRITLPAIVVGICLLDNLLLYAAIFLTTLLLGSALSSAMLLVLPLTLVVVALAAGIGLLLGIINVFVRDTGNVVPIILQLWFWFTPIVYPYSIIPETYRGILLLNPMFSIVEAYQSIFFRNSIPEFDKLLFPSILAVFFLGLSFFVFRKAIAEMIDVV